MPVQVASLSSFLPPLVADPFDANARAVPAALLHGYAGQV